MAVVAAEAGMADLAASAAAPALVATLLRAMGSAATCLRRMSLPGPHSPATPSRTSPASITTTFITGAFTGAFSSPAWPGILRLAVRRLRQLPRADRVRVPLGLLAAGRGRGVGERSRG